MSNVEITVPEGSSLHYSLLWTEPAARARFIQRLALIKAMATTLDDVQEPQVAEKKIHWWHEELQRLHDGNARHPATQQNQADLLGVELAQLACLEIVSVASTQRFTAAATTADSETALTRSFRARLALLAHALSGATDELDTGTHPELAALAFGLHDQLARLPVLIHRGLPVFSDELYQQFNTRPHDLAEHIRIAEPAKPDADASDAAAGIRPSPSTLKSIPVVTEKPGRQQLLSHAVEHCRGVLTSAMDDVQCIERYRKQSTLPIYRLLVLRRHQLDLWHKHQPDLLRERTTLTPLLKLFRAWQHRR